MTICMGAGSAQFRGKGKAVAVNTRHTAWLTFRLPSIRKTTR